MRQVLEAAAFACVIYVIAWGLALAINPVQP